MNVVFASTYFWEKDKMSFGAYPLIYNIVEGIAKTEDVTVVAGGWPKYPKVQYIGDIRVVRVFCPHTKPLYMEYFFLGSSALRGVLRDKPDIVNSQDVDGASLFWYMNKLNVSVPRILSFKGLRCEWKEKISLAGNDIGFKGRMGLFLASKWDSVCVMNSDKLIVPTKYVRDRVSDFYAIEKENIFVINNGVDLRMFKPSAVSNCHALTILCVSGFGVLKGANVAIEAYIRLRKRYHDLRFLVVGIDDVEHLKDRFAAEGIVVGKDIVFLGRVLHTHLPEIYNSCDVFVHTSYVETFGSVIAEAMACGKPVVATNDTAMPEVVGDCGFLADPGDVDGFVDAISRLLDDAALRKKMGRRARRRAEALFSVERVVDDYLKLFRGLVG